MAAIYKRGKTWWGRIQRQGREHYRSLKTADRALAEKRLRAWLEELEGTAFGEKPRRSYAEAEARFIREYLPAMRKESAARRYGVSLKNLSSYLSSKHLHEIGSAVLSDFEAKRRTERVEMSNHRHIIGVSSSTIRRDLACLSALMSAAIEWEWIEANPVSGYLKRRSRRGLKEGLPHTRYLPEDEEVQLLGSASRHLAEAAIVAIDTGLRQEEQFSLQWWQVDFARGIITTTTKTKNGRSRKVPLPIRSAAILVELKPTRAEVTDHVFINPRTGERYCNLNKGLTAAYKRAGIERICWHDLRRTAGCRWLQRDGKSMEEVSILLGHSSVLVTERSYAFLEGEKVAASLGGANVVQLHGRGRG